MGYTKKMETKLTRIKHLVDFREGGDHTATTAHDLMEMLKHVPPDARVDEVLSSEDTESGFCSIEFHEEKAV